MFMHAVLRPHVGQVVVLLWGHRATPSFELALQDLLSANVFLSLSSSRHPALHGAPHLREEQGESQALFQQFVNMAVSSECSLHQTLKALCGPDNMKSLAH